VYFPYVLWYLSYPTHNLYIWWVPGSDEAYLWVTSLELYMRGKKVGHTTKNCSWQRNPCGMMLFTLLLKIMAMATTSRTLAVHACIDKISGQSSNCKKPASLIYKLILEFNYFTKVASVLPCWWEKNIQCFVFKLMIRFCI
jgi:hypothetical protein